MADRCAKCKRESSEVIRDYASCSRIYKKDCESIYNATGGCILCVSNLIKSMSKSPQTSEQPTSTVSTPVRWRLSKNKASSSFKFRKDVVLLEDDDDIEPARLVDAGIHNKRTDPEAVELTYSDMACLEPENYLKSPIINFYLQYLKKSIPRRDVHMFNTYFYSKLEKTLSPTGDQDSQFSKLRRWWRSVDIFKKAYIILPINESMHWSLIIVCMPSKGTGSGPIILHLDSLGLHSSQKLFKIVESFLEAEWCHLQKDSSYDIPFSKCLLRNIITHKVEVPRQRNDYDCGVFMLHYVDKFIQEAPERLTQESLGTFGRQWFNHEVASGLREEIALQCVRVASEGQDKDDDTVMAISPESSDK